MTIDHKAFFAAMAKQNPHCQPTESEMLSMFWENLFQAFKGRYDEEKKNETASQEKTHDTAETRPSVKPPLPSKAKRKRTASRRKPR